MKLTDFERGRLLDGAIYYYKGDLKKFLEEMKEKGFSPFQRYPKEISAVDCCGIGILDVVGKMRPIKSDRRILQILREWERLPKAKGIILLMGLEEREKLLKHLRRFFPLQQHPSGVWYVLKPMSKRSSTRERNGMRFLRSLRKPFEPEWKAHKKICHSLLSGWGTNACCRKVLTAVVEEMEK